MTDWSSIVERLRRDIDAIEKELFLEYNSKTPGFKLSTMFDSKVLALAEAEKMVSNFGNSERLDAFYDQSNTMSIRIADLSRQVTEIALRDSSESEPPLFPREIIVQCIKCGVHYTSQLESAIDLQRNSICSKCGERKDGE